MFSNRFFGVLVAVALTAVILLAAQDALAKRGVVPGSPEALQTQKGRAADTARWNAMAEHYQKMSQAAAADRVRAQSAEIARWNAMAEYYAHFAPSMP